MTGLCTLTALSWEGDLPLPGHVVKAQNGRTAYIVMEVRRPVKPGARYAARFVCERMPAHRVPHGAVIHPWRWSGR